MTEKKKIPCRVCGKLFEPCSYCQSHTDVFRWRNFACSRVCATKYIDSACAYREFIKSNKKEQVSTEQETIITKITDKKMSVGKRKYNKRTSNETNRIGVKETI